MGVASRLPKAAPYFEATKRGAAELYRLGHVERLAEAACALAVQWCVQSGNERPPAWLAPPGLDEALARAEADLAGTAAAGGGAGG